MGPTFGDGADPWQRLDETPSVGNPDWEANIEYNEAWNSKPKEWYLPLNWANYVDQRVFSAEYDLGYRYLTMLYMGVLDLGINEFGPVNEEEMAFLVITLIASSLLNALIFGDVATLIQVLSQKEQSFQEQLDAANTVMANIELDDETSEEVREYFQKTIATQ